MTGPRIAVSATVELTLSMLVDGFSQLDDDAQAQFFCHVAAFADATYTKGMFHRAASNADYQWGKIGEHLRTCECSTERGRAMIETIYEAMKHP